MDSNLSMFLLLLIFIVVFVIIGLVFNGTFDRSNFNSVAKEDKNIYFLHISKTGGTSISNIFNSEGHDKIANDIEPNVLGLAVIRDPIDRFISSFWFAKKGGFRYKATTVEHPIHNFDSVNHFIDSLRSGDPVALEALKYREDGTIDDVNETSVIYWPQVHWLKSSSLKKLKLIDFGRMNELFQKEYDVILPLDNIGTNKKTEALTDQNVEYLKSKYPLDFQLYSVVKSHGIYNTTTNDKLINA